jgi:DNA-binding SARP family transcriptional activator
MAPPCEVRLLGGFSVSVDGRPVTVDAWRSRRAADLVKLLGLQSNHRLHREQIMEALWPNLSPEAAAANLRKAVHYARRAMGTEGAIAIECGVLELWPHGALNVDLDRFLGEADKALSSKSRDACAVAVKRYPGELLPADRYEPWAEDPRARVQARYVALLKEAGEWERVLAMDATDEEAHRALMLFHLGAGNRREAIRQFERLRNALRELIGVGPDPLTVATYEKVLELEGQQPPTPSERAAALLANGLVAWSRRDLAEAERLAREARAVALSAELSHEVGEASTLLALISYARGTWHDLFREQFADSVRRDPDMEMAVLDAHLCFQEFYLYGPEGHTEAAGFAQELLQIATRANSAAGEALATLLLGEFELLSGQINAAAETLEQAVRHAQRAACPSACSIALERLAETEVVRGNKKQARFLLERARPLAESSAISSHLVVRVLGVRVSAADRVLDALKVAQDAERVLADAPRVCEPCSMNFRVEAARVFARAGDVSRARRHIAEADRITSLWQGGPWKASVWEARAELRLAEGENAQAKALFLEAAEVFAQVRRPSDEARCREAAMTV